MKERRVDNIDNAYQVFTELMAAAESGQNFVLNPRQAALVASMVVKGRTSAAPYLEAAVRQVGGRLELDTRHLVASTGSKVKYAPNEAKGQGGVLWIEGVAGG